MCNPVNPDTVSDLARGNLCKYTRKAFELLPKLQNPRILDIGCGSGAPTIELATLCDCRIIALDNDRHQLDLLKIRLKEKGLEDKIEVLYCSINKMNFADESFDIIWSEGSIFAVGFERGLKEWRRILMPGGYMGVHDEKGNVGKKLKIIAGCGFELLDHFILDRDIWWKEYYSPLEKELHKLQDIYSEGSGISAEFRKELQEIEFFKKYPGRCESVFFVIRKKSGPDLTLSKLF
jgi:ubiquinone/menaquinone biosynthesis C-methylase UbiE